MISALPAVDTVAVAKVIVQAATARVVVGNVPVTVATDIAPVEIAQAMAAAIARLVVTPNIVKSVIKKLNT